jgi:hypothetical protein
MALGIADKTSIERSNERAATTQFVLTLLDDRKGFPPPRGSPAVEVNVLDARSATLYPVEVNTGRIAGRTNCHEVVSVVLNVQHGGFVLAGCYLAAHAETPNE